MQRNTPISDSAANDLIGRFNLRDREAFSSVYTLFYRELYYYTYVQFSKYNIEADDIIQDVFLSVWETSDLKFNTLSNIKNYIYVNIKNRFINHCKHEQVKGKYVRNAELESEDYFLTLAVESEIYSIIPEILTLLPTECARTFQLLLGGYTPKEVAEMLGKKQSTIYRQRDESIAILRRKINADTYLKLITVIATFPWYNS